MSRQRSRHVSRVCNSCKESFWGSPNYAGANPLCLPCRSQNRERVTAAAAAAPAVPVPTPVAAAPAPTPAAVVADVPEGTSASWMDALTRRQNQFWRLKTFTCKVKNGFLRDAAAHVEGTLRGLKRKLFTSIGSPIHVIVKWYDGNYGALMTFNATQDALGDISEIMTSFSRNDRIAHKDINYFGVASLIYLDGALRKYLIGIHDNLPYLYNLHGSHPVNVYESNDMMMRELSSYEDTLHPSVRQFRRNARSLHLQRNPVIVASSDEELERASRHEDDTNTSDDTCLICLMKSKTTVALPCKHMICCAGCALELKQRAHGHVKCPLCRQPVDNFLKIFR